MRDRRRSAAVVLAALALIGWTVLGAGGARADGSASPETPLERVNALVQPSIVYLQQDWAAYVYDKANKQYLNGGQQFQLSFQCTGFVVNPEGYIATAGHCVDLDEVAPAFFRAAAQWAIANDYYVADSLTVAQILAFQDYRVETYDKVNRADLTIQVGWGAAASGIQTAEVRRARVVDKLGPGEGDVALLKVEASGLNALPLSDEGAEVGTDIVSVGYPASVDSVTDPDLTPSFKDGSISSVKTVQGGLLTVYEISAAVSGGMSGGPTVDLDGQVIGVNSFGISGEPQPFNFVRPADQLAELLADAGVDNEVSDTTTAYRDGLQAYWDGDKQVAVDKLTTVVGDQPSNQLATEYLHKAQALPEPAEDSGPGVLVLLLVIGGAVVVVLAAAGVLTLLLVRRRRPGTPVPPPVPPMAEPGSVAVAPPAPVPAGRGAAPAPTVPAPTVTAPPTAPAPAAPAPAPHEHHFCAHCGEPIEHDAQFCTNCGTHVE
ncbi:trypsin-like peptidase domain-containing protein [Nocardioides sp.]|uniref:trypsin-like peptidase domain-containing protein n=1 Tax=Nocardioides sp. TaxID=35761 RepID=UPI003783EDAA